MKTKMADDWRAAADFLLRNRNIREMVDKILESIPVEVGHEHDLIPSVRELSKRNKTFKTKRKLTVEQTCRLLEMYQVSKYPGKRTSAKLATELNLSEVVVKNWFYHRRASESRHHGKNIVISKTTEVNKCIDSSRTVQQPIFNQLSIDMSLHNVDIEEKIFERNVNNESGSLAIHSSQSEALQEISDISNKQTSNTPYSCLRALDVATGSILQRPERYFDRTMFTAPFPAMNNTIDGDHMLRSTS